jgi:hypothetical protein
MGTTNIEVFSNNYYSHLDRKKQYYILFLDTKKAFDSLDHDFIIAVLEHVSLPGWIINVIRGLLHNVWVFPVLGTTTTHTIPIRRGVKQGCPLSPFLFILCYDVLLYSLAQTCLTSPLGLSRTILGSVLGALR